MKIFLTILSCLALASCQTSGNSGNERTTEVPAIPDDPHFMNLLQLVSDELGPISPIQSPIKPAFADVPSFTMLISIKGSASPLQPQETSAELLLNGSVTSTTEGFQWLYQGVELTVNGTKHPSTEPFLNVETHTNALGIGKDWAATMPAFTMKSGPLQPGSLAQGQVGIMAHPLMVGMTQLAPGTSGQLEEILNISPLLDSVVNTLGGTVTNAAEPALVLGQATYRGRSVIVTQVNADMMAESDTSQGYGKVEGLILLDQINALPLLTLVNIRGKIESPAGDGNFNYTWKVDTLLSH